MKDFSAFPNVLKLMSEIEETILSLDSLKPEIAKRLSLFSVQYTCVSGQEYLVEVKNSNSKCVPANWRKISRYSEVFTVYFLMLLQCCQHEFNSLVICIYSFPFSALSKLVDIDLQLLINYLVNCKDSEKCYEQNARLPGLVCCKISVITILSINRPYLKLLL